MIRVIVKNESDIDDLGIDWMPDALHAPLLKSVFKELLGYAPNEKQFTHDKENTLIHFTIDDMRHPRAISFSCIPSAPEAELIRSLAKELNARIYDSETCEFIQLCKP